jgi:hypothetical protein
MMFHASENPAFSVAYTWPDSMTTNRWAMSRGARAMMCRRRLFLLAIQHPDEVMKDFCNIHIGLG